MPPARLARPGPATATGGATTRCPAWPRLGCNIKRSPFPHRARASRKGDSDTPPRPDPPFPLAAPATLLLLGALARPPGAIAGGLDSIITWSTAFDFLLHHPVVAAVVAGAAVWGVPRAVRTLTSTVLLPLAVLALAATVVAAPQVALTAASSSSNFVSSHPVLCSCLVLGGAALALSPFLLLAALVAVLAFGLPRLPAPLRPALPAPVVEVERGVASLRAAAAKALAPALAEGGKAAAAARARLDGGRAVAEGAGRVGAALAGAASRLEATAAQAMSCRAEPTPAARAACVRAQNHERE